MEEKIAFYYTEKGEYAPKEGLPFSRRKNVAAIVKYESSYLFLSWNETNYDRSLVTGGIDEGEEKEESVKREVIEETGYYDIKRVVSIDCINISKFYVEHKNQNREAVYYPYLVELNSLKQKEVDGYEKKEHTCIWVKKDEIPRVQLFTNHRKMLEKALELNDNE